MPNLDRRGFLRLSGAAGLVPFLPSVPARAVAATTNVPTSKALWAGIYAKSGSVPRFASVAGNMGLSNAAIQGVAARSVGVKIALSAAVNPITRAGNAVFRIEPVKADRLNNTGNVLRDIENAVLDEEIEATEGQERGAEPCGQSDAQDQPEKD